MSAVGVAGSRGGENLSDARQDHTDPGNLAAVTAAAVDAIRIAAPSAGTNALTPLATSVPAKSSRSSMASQRSVSATLTHHNQCARASFTSTTTRQIVTTTNLSAG